MPRPKKSDNRHGEGIPPSGRMKDEGGRMNESGPADLTHPSSFIPQPSEVAKADEGRPEPVEVPAIEAIYTEVLAQELERRGWECFPPDGPDA